MPRIVRNGDTWQTCPPPQTAVQRHAFLDLCVDFLARDVSDETCVAFAPRTSAAGVSALTRPDRIAHTRAELRLEFVRACALCGSTDRATRPVVANPYARRHLVLVCETCRTL